MMDVEQVAQAEATLDLIDIAECALDDVRIAIRKAQGGAQWVDVDGLRLSVSRGCASAMKVLAAALRMPLDGAGEVAP